MKAVLLVVLLLVCPMTASAQRVFDTHVHIWNGETSLRDYEAQLKTTHQSVTRFAGILIAKRGKMAETRRKNDELRDCAQAAGAESAGLIPVTCCSRA
jgi:uncharacterized protein